MHPLGAGRSPTDELERKTAHDTVYFTPPLNMIESSLYYREGASINNFSSCLPASQSSLAQELTKDPYNFDFLTLRDGYLERELEDALTDNITKFLIELGNGFAYVGRQVRLEVGGDEFFIDLLFYHLKLRSYVVIELLCCAQHNKSYVA